MAPAERRAAAGSRAALVVTLLHLGMLVLLPLLALVATSLALGWRAWWAAVGDPRVVAALRLSLGTAFAAALASALLGLLIAWVLVRYAFPGRRVVDALIDLPFALPTAVAGIALTALYAPTGWLGAPLARAGLRVAFTPLGIVAALTFLGVPFVVRALQPALRTLGTDAEEAATLLGASPWRTFRHVLLPALAPAWRTGTLLAFARGVGEYGSVIFIAGNMPMRTEIAPLVIMGRLEQYDYAGAAAVAVALLLLSFLLRLAIALPGWGGDPEPVA